MMTLPLLVVLIMPLSCLWIGSSMAFTATRPWRTTSSTTTTTTRKRNRNYCCAFTQQQQQQQQQARRSSMTDAVVVNGMNGDSEVMSSVNANAAPIATSSYSTAEEYFKSAEILEFILKEHKPLGCTVEESLAKESDDAKHVFLSKIVDGGNAEKVGLQVGDVVVGVSGVFDDIDNVVGVGIEKVKALASARRDDQLLILQIARGTDILERHESALVDLCTLAGDVHDDFDACLNVIDGEGYPTPSLDQTDDDENENDDNDSIIPKNFDCSDTEAECLLDTMFEGWGEELPNRSAEDEKKDNPKELPKKKIAPWSSRSSPSGTFVRDPVTGQMKNIDLDP